MTVLRSPANGAFSDRLENTVTLVRTPALLAILSLGVAGCWPIIPGKWSDYDVPEQSLITGHMDYLIPIGTYWDDTTPSGIAWWGVFDQPQIITGYEVLGVPDQCVSGSTAIDPVLAAMSAAGSGTSRLIHGDTELRLPWSTANNVYITNFGAGDWVDDTTYNLAQLEFAEYPPFAIEQLFLTPPDSFRITSPVMDGDAPAEGSLDNLAFTWTGNGGDYVYIAVAAISDGSVADLVECLVPDRGSYTVPAELFTSSSFADTAIVSMGPVFFEGGPSPVGENVGYRTTTGRFQQGAIYLQGVPAR